MRALFPLLALLLCAWGAVTLGGGTPAPASDEYTHSAVYTDDSSSVWDAGTGGTTFLRAAAANSIAYTVECWVKGNDSTASFRTVFGRRVSATDFQNQFVIESSVDDEAIGLADSLSPRNTWTAASAQADCSNCADDGTWHHWAWTRDASTKINNLYIDGDLITRDVDQTGNEGTASDEIEFGNVDEFGEFLDGNLFMCRVWQVNRCPADDDPCTLLQSHDLCEVANATTDLWGQWPLNNSLTEVGGTEGDLVGAPTSWEEDVPFANSSGAGGDCK